MASRMIGRTVCPECGFAGAHVKESDKCLYRYCPDCGSQHYAKSTSQRANLTAKTRPLDAATGSDTTATPTAPEKAAHAPVLPPVTTGSEPSATPAATVAAPVAKNWRKGLFA